LRPPDIAEPEKPFDEPWQAKAFALAVHLNEQGLFSWSEWTQRFAGIAREIPLPPDQSESAAYWRNWILTLERMIAERGQGTPDQIEGLAAAWRKAFETTPHGQPVKLNKNDGVPS
jgi:nitrile hydratase accessory protein